MMSFPVLDSPGCKQIARRRVVDVPVIGITSATERMYRSLD
ncbi:hypothetical protein [Rhodococcus yananensis]